MMTSFLWLHEQSYFLSFSQLSCQSCLLFGALPVADFSYSAPEQFGMAPDGVGAVERRNLSELANLLTHVAGQGYTDTPDQRLIRTPLEAFITAMAFPFREWLLDGKLHNV